jgi:hypothetical protein
VYPQLGPQPFLAGLSAVDRLFNCGPVPLQRDPEMKAA